MILHVEVGGWFLEVGTQPCAALLTRSHGVPSGIVAKTVMQLPQTYPLHLGTENANVTQTPQT